MEWRRPAPFALAAYRVSSEFSPGVAVGPLFTQVSGGLRAALPLVGIV